MEVLHNGSNGSNACRGNVLAIGNFDGIHRGHQGVLEVAGNIAGEKGVAVAAMVFEPHPRAFFQPDRNLFRLTPLPLKTHLMEALGFDNLVVMTFDAGLAALTAEDFIRNIIVSDLGVSHVVVGYDFQFGRGRSGNADILREFGEKLGFGVTVVDAISPDAPGEAYSSTAIRNYLRDGEPRKAAEGLGYWWTVAGTVIPGDKVGRTLGYPTANISVDPSCELHLGIYVVRVRQAGDTRGPVWKGVASFGRRPTFDKQDVLLEVFIFDFDADIYGVELYVEILDFIRPEEKFSGIEELKAHIARDCVIAGEFHDHMETDGDPLVRFTLGRRFEG